MKKYRTIFTAYVMVFVLAVMPVSVFAEIDNSDMIGQAYVLTDDNALYSEEIAPYAMGLTSMSIVITKSGSTAYIKISEGSSHTSSRIGNRYGEIQQYINGSWQKVGTLNESYDTYTDYYNTTYSFTMASGAIYRIYTQHYCALSVNGNTYSQYQYSDTFTR